MAGYRRVIGKIYIVVGLSCLLLTASLYLFGFKPLSDRLRVEHAYKITHFLDSGLSFLEGVLNKHRGLARQSASRTAIRDKQIAYLKGSISIDKLMAFSVPKLADAMNANQEIVGISRFAPDGKLLFDVGLPVDKGVVAACGLSQLREIRILGPIQMGEARRLLYCSPIIDQDAGYVGADILTIDDRDITGMIDVPQEGLGNFGIVHQGRIIYWPRKLEDTEARSALEAHLGHGYVDQSYVLDSLPVKDSDWLLYAVVNKDRFFSGINRQRLIMLGMVFVVTVFVFVLTVFALRPVIHALLREKQLFELSHRDGLTGLFNHAYMQELLDHEHKRSQRYGRPFSVLMFDVDHFKTVNDTYGHQAGDEVLKCLGELVLQTVRNIDLAARYGGEEFLVILPETGSEGALILAEKLRIDISQQTVATGAGDIAVTISVGVVTCDACGNDFSKQQIIYAVDKAMYMSKRGGRNRVTVVDLKESA